MIVQTTPLMDLKVLARLRSFATAGRCLAHLRVDSLSLPNLLGCMIGKMAFVMAPQRA